MTKIATGPKAGTRGAPMAKEVREPGGFSSVQRAALGVVGMGAALSIMAGTAMAAPLNPTPPGSNPTPPTSNPAPPRPVQVAPSNQGRGAIPDPPSTSGWRVNPATNNAPSTWRPQAAPRQAPTYVQTVVGPVRMAPPPPMILPEPGMVRIGNYQEVKPPWMTMAEMNSINRWAAYAESEMARALYAVDPSLTEDEATQRAASAMAAGLVGGAGGAATGAAIGTAIGFGVGVSTGIVLLPVPIFGTPFWITQGATGALIGGTIGAAVVGIPSAAVGAALGAGDPDQIIDQPWTYRDGQGLIKPKKSDLEFDWNGPASPLAKDIHGNPLPAEAHINVQVKDDGTWVAKLGEERWIGATADQRQKHFYDEINMRIPGAGDAVKDWMEDPNGGFQQGAKNLMADINHRDPGNTEYNPNGEIKDTSVRAERIPYPSSSTPDPWDEPNRAGVAEQNRRNQEAANAVAPAQQASAPAAAPAAAPVAPPAPPAAPAIVASAPVMPVEVQQVVDTTTAQVNQAAADVQQAVDGANQALGDLIPRIPGI